MGELMDALGAIGGLAFGAVIIMLVAPTVDPYTPVNLAGLGFLFFGGAVLLTIVLIIVVIQVIASEL